MGGCFGGTGMMPYTDQGKGKKEEKNGGKEEARAGSSATIVVRLPADAKLTVDGAATKSKSSRRVFATPALQTGQVYYYTLKATVVREGRPITAQRRVQVRAGRETPVKFDFTTTSVALKK
jgi:uncharacterized protein (TIGR03000 family)